MPRPKSLLRLLSLSFSIFVAAACSHTPPEGPPQRTVDSVDLERYQGTWYEIARYPNRFQRGCVGTTATYAPGKKEGLISVTNRCRQDSLDGKARKAVGRARVVDRTSNAKLEVSFFGPFWGDYWIIDLDPDYRWAVVGHPDRSYLWILSREPQMDEATYARLVAGVKAQGYDPSRLLRTPQAAKG